MAHRLLTNRALLARSLPPPVFDGPQLLLPFFNYFFPFLLSRPPSPFRDRGSASGCIAPRLAVARCTPRPSAASNKLPRLPCSLPEGAVLDSTCCWVGFQHKLESLGGNLGPTPCSSPLCFSHRAISSRSLRFGLLGRFALWLHAPAFTLPETRAVGDERSLLLNADASMERLRRCSRSPTVTAQRSQPTGAVEC